MASQLSRNEVAHIATLAQIDLTPAEQETFARQLTDILKYAATIQQADTSGIDPDAATAEARLPGPREDTPAPSLDRKAALAIAPDARADAGLFRVPKVL
jgi:aspartyl-tRNA(Asn)/glutamyl-tRNA(Gln) amidotransferase subunit C